MSFIRRFAQRMLAVVGVAAAVAASVFALSGSVSLAQTGAAPKILTGPTVSSITEDSAIIRWTTDVESTTVVDFGTTDSLGQTYRKIIPIEETEVTEISHTMTLSPLKAGTRYFFKVSSSTSGGTASSAIVDFTSASPACGPDAWTCTDWSACEKGTGGSYGQTRSCSVSAACADAGVPKPQTSQSCTPACTEDTWTCGNWQACSAGGTQTRACTLTTDCPTASTPKPATSQSCRRPCTADDWKCGEWGDCSKETQTRSCALPTTCSGTPAKPAESQKCVMPKPACTDKDWICGEWGACSADGKAKRDCSLPTTCLPVKPDEKTRSEIKDCPPAGAEGDKKPEEPASPTGQDLNEPLPPDANVPFSPSEPPAPPVPPLSASTVLGGGDESAALLKECADNNIGPDRCPAWLDAKYGDRSCEENGIFSKEACVAFLRKTHGGTVPGCEGKTEAECSEILARMMAGYMPGDMHDEIDAMIGTTKAGEMFDALGDAAPSVLAVRASHKDKVRWWPSKRSGDQETSPGMFVIDTDKDGLPDDVEKRLGTDPNVPDAAVAREILKKFFEAGDKPAPEQLAVRERLKSFFETGDKPSQDDARAAMAAFFGPGTPPGSVNAIDAAFILGLAVGQPTGSGTTDDSFTVDATSSPDAADGGGITLHGHAAPGAVIFLYVYSYVPMVLTTTADDSGNYQYDISDNVVDGSHTAYVALVDGAGDVAAKSRPQSFFVKTALAVTESDFLATDAKLTPTTPASKATSVYLYGVAALLLVALIAVGFVMRGTRKRKGAAPSPTGPTPPKPPAPPPTAPPAPQTPPAPPAASPPAAPPR